MFKYIKYFFLFYTYFTIFINIKTIKFIKLFIKYTPIVLYEIKKLIKRRWRRFYNNINNPRKFYKYIPFWLVLLKIRPTPKKIGRWTLWTFIKISSFYRSSFTIFMSLNQDHKYYTFYWVINLSIFLYIKWYQEVYLNFTCPLATLLYGKFVKKERKWKIKKLEKEARKKLHKFVADPFYTRADKIRIQAQRDKKLADGIAIDQAKLDIKKDKWSLAKEMYTPQKKKKRKCLILQQIIYLLCLRIYLFFFLKNIIYYKILYILIFFHMICFR